MIRLATYKDVESINKLGSILTTNFKETYNLSLYLKNDNYIIIVNEEQDINGFIIIYRNIDYYELEMIIIAPEFRNKGIASSLIKYFLYNFTKEKDEILLEVAVNNERAIKLYQKFNFEVIDVRKKYYKNIDAYVMKKVI